MTGRDPLEGIPAEARDWHEGALAGDPAVCGAPQPMQPGYPCIWSKGFHEKHQDVYGRTWPNRPEEQLHVARKVPVAGGMVTVQTSDHGAVTLPEPAWCTGHAVRVPGHRVDLTHTGPEHPFAFDGETLFVAMLSQDPFSPDPARRKTRLYVEQTGHAATLDPSEIRRLAAAFTVHAVHLRTLADQVDRLGDEEAGL
ncbi:DUF6907 domain-containing protein [Streptomyces hydrogenans]|uniref:DUF6907 domain-containing protein n=1 Tax=Streptomyces hydrogenans TaxID=1873719 RepID=UPI0036D10037